MFLVKGDYSSQIRDEILDIITNAQDSSLWDDAELKAQSQIESYINHRYDVAAIFITVSTYNVGTTYNVGDHVEYTGSIYYAILAGAGNTPTNTTYWTKGDKRNKHIIRLTIDVTLYILHNANNARAIPEHIQKNYDDAITWLTQVSKGIIGPGLPTIALDPGNPVRWGGEEKQGSYW